MRLLRELIDAEHERGATIIFSTHVMHQAEQLCDHIVMIHDGEKVLDDSLARIRARHDPRLILLEPIDGEAGGEAEIVARLAGVAGVAGVARADDRYQVTLEDATAAPDAMRDLVAAVPPARVELHRPTLEDVFLRIVTEPGAAAAAGELRASVRADTARPAAAPGEKEP